jgi:hypothetical protein
MSSATNHTDLPQTWEQFIASDDPIDFEEFLKSDALAIKRQEGTNIMVARCVSGSLSAIASTAIIWHILRSHARLSTTYNRLVFGMCIADIIYSIANFLTSVLLPKELDYLLPFAKGNMATCNMQGFLVVLGSMLASIYNSSICLYYLAIIKYNKNDEFIKNKIEPWLHCVPIIFTFSCSMTFLVSETYNYGGSTGGRPTLGCYISIYRPPHCVGYDDGEISKGYSIPCGRGDMSDKPVVSTIFKMAFSTNYFVVPLITFGSLLLIYREVLTSERKMRRYGISSLRLRTKSVRRSPTTNQHGGGIDNDGLGGPRDAKTMMKSITDSFKSFTSNCDSAKHTPACKPCQFRSKKRAVLYLTFWYSIAWSLTFVPYILFMLFPQRLSAPAIALLKNGQGYFNWCVYIFPKVRNTRIVKGGKEMKWWQAFWKTWTSRTEAKVTKASIRSAHANTISRRGPSKSQRSTKTTGTSSAATPQQSITSMGLTDGTLRRSLSITGPKVSFVQMASYTSPSDSFVGRKPKSILKTSNFCKRHNDSIIRADQDNEKENGDDEEEMGPSFLKRNEKENDDDEEEMGPSFLKRNERPDGDRFSSVKQTENFLPETVDRTEDKGKQVAFANSVSFSSLR